MKAILLNDGGYCGLENVEFPVEVECDFVTRYGRQLRSLVGVSADELFRIGMDPCCLAECTEFLSFFVRKEIELKSENA